VVCAEHIRHTTYSEKTMIDKESKLSTDVHTPCVACKSNILVGASVCPICKSYQSRWKNELYYYSRIAGIIIVVISLVAYMTSTWPEIKRTLFWQDSVDITAFDSKNKIVLYNSGDGKVFVSHVSLRSEKLGHASAIL
jgi:hypothetical protein